MINDFTEISARGKRIKVPSVTVGDRVVIVRGGLLRMATVHQEDWMAEEPVRYAEQFLATLKKEKIDADIFSFSQRLPERSKKYGYHAEWDNVAAIPLTCYQDWWEKRLPQVARKNIKRGGKRGVVAKVVDYDDELVTGIVGIQNDSPTRQGMPFVHYGKDFAVVKGDYGSFMDTSEFIGAYFEDELIGLIKLVYMGKCASIMQILSKPTHYDKRPTNVLRATITIGFR